MYPWTGYDMDMVLYDNTNTDSVVVHKNALCKCVQRMSDPFAF